MSVTTTARPPAAVAPSLETFCRVFDRNDLATAEELAPQLLSGTPRVAIDVLTRLALLRRRDGQVDAAVEALLDAERLASQTAEATGSRLPDWFHSELSGCYLQQRDWGRALASAEAGITIKPALGLTAVTALINLGRLGEARDMLQRAVLALGNDPQRAAAVAAVGTAMIFADQAPETQNVVAQAAAAWPDSSYFEPLRGALSILRERTATVENMGAGVAEAALLADPDSEPALFRLRDALARTCSPEEATQALTALQARTPTVLPALMMYLARTMRPGALLAQFAEQLESWTRTPAVADCMAYLDAVCRFTDPAPGVIGRVLALPDTQLRLFVLLRQPQQRTIQIRSPTVSETTEFARAGIDIKATQNFLDGLVGPLSPEWAASLDGAEFASPEAEQIVRADERFTAFQDRIVRDQAFAMIDPTDGTPADLFDSVKIHDRQVFAFRGTELLTFHTGGNMNFALFIHLVRRNIVLVVDTKANPSKQGFYAGPAYMAEVQAVWLKRAARNHAALLRAAADAPATRGTRRRVVAIHGRAENPAHHSWNYLPPFERLAAAGTIGHIGAVLVPPTRYFGTITDVFPELAHTPLIELPEAAAIDPCPFSPTDIALQLGGSFIPATLMRRIRGWAERRVDPQRRANIERLRQHRPIVWVGLRVGDKVWVNQTAGIARMIDLIVPLYPDALFVLDGFSLPDDAAGVPTKWRDAADALETVAAEIGRATQHPAAVHSLVGNRISESVLWAEAADVYFTPFGSSQHKVGWYGSAPGLVYTSENLAKRPAAMRQGSWEAEGSPVPHFLIGRIAEPGRRRGNYDYRTNLDNIDFEPHVAARRLLAILGAAEFTPRASRDGCCP